MLKAKNQFPLTKPKTTQDMMDRISQIVCGHLEHAIELQESDFQYQLDCQNHWWASTEDFTKLIIAYHYGYHPLMHDIIQVLSEERFIVWP